MRPRDRTRRSGPTMSVRERSDDDDPAPACGACQALDRDDPVARLGNGLARLELREHLVPQRRTGSRRAVTASADDARARRTRCSRTARAVSSELARTSTRPGARRRRARRGPASPADEPPPPPRRVGRSERNARRLSQRGRQDTRSLPLIQRPASQRFRCSVSVRSHEKVTARRDSTARSRGRLVQRGLDGVEGLGARVWQGSGERNLRACRSDEQRDGSGEPLADETQLPGHRSGIGTPHGSSERGRQPEPSRRCRPRCEGAGRAGGAPSSADTPDRTSRLAPSAARAAAPLATSPAAAW